MGEAAKEIAKTAKEIVERKKKYEVLDKVWNMPRSTSSRPSRKPVDAVSPSPPYHASLKRFDQQLPNSGKTSGTPDNEVTSAKRRMINESASESAIPVTASILGVLLLVLIFFLMRRFQQPKPRRQPYLDDC